MTRRSALALALAPLVAPFTAWGPSVRAEELWPDTEDDSPVRVPAEYLCIIDSIRAQGLRGEPLTDVTLTVNGWTGQVPVGDLQSGAPFVRFEAGDGMPAVHAPVLRQWCWDQGIPSASVDEFAGGCAIYDWPEGEEA